MLKTSHPFGVALRLLRTRRRLKQWEVAEKAGMTKAMLSSYETGKVTPTLQSLSTLFQALETDYLGLQDALEAVERTDRILDDRKPPLEEGRPSREVTVPKARSEDDGSEAQDGGQLFEALVLRMNGIEGQLERIATDLMRGLRREAGEKPARAVSRGLDR